MASSFYDEISVNDQQTRQYKLLEQLQTLVMDLPMRLQQRLPYSLLSDIAASLLDNSIFTIVGDIEEIQHLTEKNLYTQRQKLLEDHRGLKHDLRKKQREELQTCRPHNMPIMTTQHKKQKSDLDVRLQAELHQMDKNILLELDQKVLNQQTTLQSVGIPGFFATSDVEEVNLQMAILQLIKDLMNR